MDEIPIILCANCCEPYPDDGFSLSHGFNETESSKSVSTMLSILYKLTYLGILTSKDKTVEQEEEEEFRLCPNCSYLLNDLYNLYDKFNGLRKVESSSLAKKIKSLDIVIEDCSKENRNKRETKEVGTAQNVELLLRQDIFTQEENSSKDQNENQSLPAQQPKNYREYENSILANKEIPLDERMKGPWLRIRRLEDITFQSLGYAPVNLLEKIEESNLNSVSSWDHPSPDHCDDDPNDSDFDVEHEMKLFGDPVIIETGNEVLDFETSRSGRPSRPSSGRRRVPSIRMKEIDIEEENDTPKGRVRQKKLKRLNMKKSNSKKKMIKQEAKKVMTQEIEEDDFFGSVDADNVDKNEAFLPSIFDLKLANKRNDPSQEGTLKSVNRPHGNFSYLYSKRLQNSPCPCLYCLDDFETPEERASHVKKKHRCAHMCQKCGRKFKSKNSINYHSPRCGQVLESMKKYLGPFKCSEIDCGKEFNEKRNLTSHMKTHRERNFSCEKCPMTFKTQIALQRHISNRHEHDDSAKVQCPECPSVLKNQAALKGHYHRKHTAEGSLRYKEYSKKSEERRKRRRVATTTDGFVCTDCNVDFQTKNRLSKHRLEQHPHLINNKCICDTCGKSFKGFYQLRKHQTFVHTDIRPFMCESCGKYFKSIDNLKNHQKLSHNDEARKVYNAYTREKNRQRKMIEMQLAKKAIQENSNFITQDHVLEQQQILEQQVLEQPPPPPPLGNILHTTFNI